jgi:hypothetical protein
MRLSSAARRHSVALPLLIGLTALIVVATAAAVMGYDPWDSATWSRWDSGLYEDIARDGYDLFRCADEPQKWCGDAAWFPGYPWVFGGLHKLGLPLLGAGVFVSWFFAIATIVLLWATFLEKRTDSAVLAALVYAAFVPGQIYNFAIFPLSMLAFATVASLWFLYRGRALLAGIAGAIAAMTYPAGVLLAPIAAIWFLTRRAIPLGDRLVGAATAGGLTLVGFWIVVIDQALETGRWNAFFLVQEKYKQIKGSENPFVVTWDVIRGAIEHSSGVAVAVGVQTALVTLVLLVVAARWIWNWRVRESVDSMLLLWGAVAWALPLSQSWSIQRGQAVLLPMAVLVARLPARMAWPLAGGAVGVAVWMEYYFLDWSLI